MKKLIALTLVLVLVAGCSAPTLKLGLGMVSNVTITAASDKDGKTQVDTTACAVTLDANGKVVGISWDSTQGKAAFGIDGTAKSEAGEVATKREIGDAYGMKGASGIQKEWYEQIAALETYAKGKTPDAVTGVGSVADIEELKTGCTMSIGDYQASLTKAVANAK